MILTREQILNAPDRKGEPVDVPEWGGTVLVAPMTAVDRDELETRFLTGREGDGLAPEVMRGLRAFVAAACIVDEHGKALFTRDDIEALGKRSAIALDRVHTAGWKASGLQNDSEEQARKNSETPLGDFSTD